jgi:hypothetical protein
VIVPRKPSKSLEKHLLACVVLTWKYSVHHVQKKDIIFLKATSIVDRMGESQNNYVESKTPDPNQVHMIPFIKVLKKRKLLYCDKKPIRVCGGEEGNRGSV